MLALDHRRGIRPGQEGSDSTETSTANLIGPGSQQVTNAFVLRCIKNDWPVLSVSRHFAVCHEIWLYRRDAVAANLPKKFKFKKQTSRTIFPG